MEMTKLRILSRNLQLSALVSILFLLRIISITCRGDEVTSLMIRTRALCSFLFGNIRISSFDYKKQNMLGRYYFSSSIFFF